eukprot:NODE_103_length_20051_cov_0.229401.p13 type:complete len:141 gc:universal NODE_103_length_20051_cov_0.229401:9249-9671(+)
MIRSTFGFTFLQVVIRLDNIGKFMSQVILTSTHIHSNRRPDLEDIGLVCNELLMTLSVSLNFELQLSGNLTSFLEIISSRMQAIFESSTKVARLLLVWIAASLKWLHSMVISLWKSSCFSACLLASKDVIVNIHLKPHGS